jgi:hypothetical protein
MKNNIHKSGDAKVAALPTKKKAPPPSTCAPAQWLRSQTTNKHKSDGAKLAALPAKKKAKKAAPSNNVPTIGLTKGPVRSLIHVAVEDWFCNDPEWKEKLFPNMSGAPLHPTLCCWPVDNKSQESS